MRESESAPDQAAAGTGGRPDQPGVVRWALKVAAATGLTGMLCCVAPAVLFAFGLMGGIYAISFANFFYREDGGAATGAWILRGAAIAIGLLGILLFRFKQNQCSIDPRRKRLNLALVTILVAVLGVAFYFTFEKVSGWYFDEYIVPAQQAEYEARQGQEQGQEPGQEQEQSGRAASTVSSERPPSSDVGPPEVGPPEIGPQDVGPEDPSDAAERTDDDDDEELVGPPLF